MWGVSSQLLQQSAAVAPYLGRVAHPDLEHGVAPLGLHVPAQLPLLVIAPSLIVFKSKVYITFISITDVLYTSLGLNSSS